jgi:hypothetical protein
VLPAAPLLHQGHASMRRPADYLDDDEAHKGIVEEQRRQAIATLAVGQLDLPTPYALERRWFSMAAHDLRRHPGLAWPSALDVLNELHHSLGAPNRLLQQHVQNLGGQRMRLRWRAC